VSPAQTPPEDCEIFLDAYCGHIADCVVQNGGHSGFSAEMEKSMCITQQGLSCGKAVAVSASYNQCLADAKQTDCSRYFSIPTNGEDDALPTTCEGVIRVLK